VKKSEHDRKLPFRAAGWLALAFVACLIAWPGSSGTALAESTVKITSPKDGATVTGPDVKITVDVGTLHLVPAGNATNNNQMHIHYLLDVDPSPYLGGKRDIPFGDPHIIHSADLSHTFTDVSPGPHQVTVILTYADHIAVQPPVAPTVHFTVTGGMAWDTLATLPTARYAMGVTTLGGKVYAIGGSDGSDPMNTVEAYDPTTNTWAAKAPMPTPRLDLGVAVAGGKIYAIGGFDGNRRLASVEAYDPTTNTWSPRASLPTPRSALGVATASNGKIYAIGGCSGNQCDQLATVEEYDPTTNTWTTRAPMPVARSGLRVVAATNGLLYAIGGCTGSLCDRVATVEAYNPATNSWSTKSSLPSPRDSFGAALGANGKIYVVGGGNTGTQLADVDQYDPATDTWTAMTSLPKPRTGLSLATTADGKLLAIGGVGSGGLVELATVPGPFVAATTVDPPLAAPSPTPIPSTIFLFVVGAVAVLGVAGGSVYVLRLRKGRGSRVATSIEAMGAVVAASPDNSGALAAIRPWGVHPPPSSLGNPAGNSPVTSSGAPSDPTVVGAAAEALSGYQITGEPKYGGMAVVYKAFQPALDRNVALKVMLPHLARDPSFVERFYREARRTAKLEHPNIVPIYDLGQLGDGSVYIAMRYIDGMTVQDVVKKQGPLSAERACNLAIAVAEALDYAHRLGIVHRDVKPSNILVEAGDRVTLTDFGIAKAFGSSGDGNDVELTHAGAVVGTPKYLSPEQAIGQPADTRSDLYSLGIVLYEMLAGRPPFDGESATAILKAHITTPPPPPSSFGVDVPPAIQAVTLKALEKEPAERFQTAREFIVALRRASGGTLG